MPHLDELIKTIKESQKTLFILCGFPYAGKSFVAEELRKHTDIVYVSIDTIFHAHGFDWDTNKLPTEDEWRQIFNESHEISKMSLREGKNVLYDSTNQTLSSRDTLRGVTRLVGAKSKVIFVQCSPETVWKRWKKSLLENNRPSVDRSLVQMTINQFEAPMDSESIITIRND